MKQKVPEITRSKYAILTIDAIFSRPIFRLVDFIEYSEIPTRSAQRILEQLKNAGVLEVLRERIGRRPAVYVFPQLIAISEGRR